MQQLCIELSKAKIKINNLRQSPIFNLSLSSKELFHSNFIAWLLDSYPKKMGDILAENLNIPSNCNEVYDVKREKKSIDISFKIGDTSVFIENKIKSIAYKEQLINYSKELEIQDIHDVRCIILSIIKPTFLNGDDLFISTINDMKNLVIETNKKNNIKKLNIIKHDIEWQYLSYMNLITVLQQLVSTGISNYHKLLVDDYIQFITILDKDIVGKINRINVINLYKKLNCEKKFLDELKDLRVGDLFQKGVFENFSNIIFNTFKSNKDKYSNIEIYQDEDGKNIIKVLHISHGMSNSVGLMHLTYNYSHEFKFGVQIQGTQYRLFVEGLDESSIMRLATNIVDADCGFFNFPKLFSDIKIRPIKNNGEFSKVKFTKKVSMIEQKKENYHLVFNKFHTPSKNNLFLYKSITMNQLDMEVSNQELADVICQNIYEMIKIHKAIVEN